MKMLFYSADLAEVQQACIEFSHAGIRSEVRHSPPGPPRLRVAPCAELWIHDDRDCHRALMLCVQLGIGFSRRPRSNESTEPLEETVETREVLEMD
jgi:hypothetical protein